MIVKEFFQENALSIGITFVGMIVVLVLAWLQRENDVSRRAIKARKKSANEQVCNMLSVGFEAAVRSGKLSDADRDYWFARFHKIGLRDLTSSKDGITHEPNMGKPWKFWQWERGSPKPETVKKHIRKKQEATGKKSLKELQKELQHRLP